MTAAPHGANAVRDALASGVFLVTVEIAAPDAAEELSKAIRPAVYGDIYIDVPESGVNMVNLARMLVCGEAWHIVWRELTATNGAATIT